MDRTEGTGVMELPELIKRVGGLTGPDREVDAAVGRCVGMEVREYHGLYRNKGEGGWVPVATYTASVDAVIQLIGERMPGAEWALCGPPECHGRIYPASWAEDGMDYSGKATTPALALLLAFLRAWEARGEKG